MKKISIIGIFLFSSLMFCYSEVNQTSINSSSASDTVQVNELISQSDEFLYNHPEKALDAAKKAENIAKNINFQRGFARSLERQGNAYLHLGNKESAQNAYFSALEIAESSGFHKVSGPLLYNIGNLYYEKGWYDSTLMYIQKAQQKYLEVNDSSGYALCLFMQGQVHGNQGNYYNSLKSKLEALAVFRKLNMKTWETDCLMSVAETYADRGKYQKTIDIYKSCLEYYRSTDDKKFECATLRELGFQYSNLKQYQKSLDLFDESLKISNNLGYKPESCKTLSRKGDIYLLLNDFINARKNFDASYKLSVELKDEYYQARNLAGLANCDIKMGKYNKAIRELNLAHEFSHKTNDKVLYRDINNLYYLAYEALGDYKKSLSYHKLLLAIKDSLFHEEKSRQLDEIAAEYDIASKEKQINNLETQKEISDSKRKLTIILLIATIVLGLLITFFLIFRNKKNKELLHKEKEIDKLKSRFFADISHEFRTPLTLILGPLSVLMKDKSASAFYSTFQDIENNARKLLQLVNQILDLSKLEAGKYELHPIHGNFSEFLQTVVMTFHSQAEIKNINYTINIENDEILSDFDPENLEIVFNNIISNALKFEPENGTIEIIAEKNKSDKKDNKIVCCIINHNSYIESNRIPHLFNRFYSDPDKDTSHNTKISTGIGLALSKELIELHQGNIRVESSKTNGTAFIVELPLKLSNITSSPDLNQSRNYWNTYKKVIKDVPESFENKKDRQNVLIIEDNTEVRKFIAHCIRENYSISVAENGETGIKKAIEEIPDIIISDIMMPVKDGLEVARNLKNHELTSHIPIILLTAKASDDSKLEGLKTLADDYLTKPFNPEELNIRMHNLLENRKKVVEKYSGRLLVNTKSIDQKSMNDIFLEKISEIIEENLADETFGVEELVASAGFSRSQLHRKITALTNQSTSEFIRNFRLEHANELLKNNTGTASEIAYMVGFASPIYFNKCFKEYFGTTPGQVRRQKSETGI